MKSLGSFLKLQGFVFVFFFCGGGRNLFVTATLLWVCIFRSCCGLVINSKEWPQGNCNMLMKPHTLHNFLEDSFYRFHIGEEMNHKEMCYLENDKSLTTFFFFPCLITLQLIKTFYLFTCPPCVYLLWILLFQVKSAGISLVKQLHSVI